MSEPTATLESDLASLAQTHVEQAKNFFRLDLDFSPQSLQLIDHAITKFHGNKAELDSTITLYGAYVGETVRRALGGTWVRTDEETPPQLNDVGGSATVFPFAWAYKRFTNGEDDLIAFKYQALLGVLNRGGEAPPKIEIPDEPEPEPKRDVSGDEILERAPMLAFAMVAAADGNIDKKEMLKFQEILLKAPLSGSALYQHVVVAMLPNFEKHAQQCAELGPLGWSMELLRLSTFLDENHAAEASAFKQILFDIAKQVAESSGGSWFGFGTKVSKAEQAGLDMLKTCLGLEKS